MRCTGARARTRVQVRLQGVEAMQQRLDAGEGKDSEPSCSISDSIRCASSPSRKAPARRELPLSVCKARSTSSRAPRLSGRAVHCRKAPPSCGISSSASSSKMGNRSGSIASVRSMSSGSWSSSTGARGGATGATGASGRGGNGPVAATRTALTDTGAAGWAAGASGSTGRAAAADAGGVGSSSAKTLGELLFSQLVPLRNLQVLERQQRVDERHWAPSGSRRRTDAASAGFPRLPR